MSELFPNRRRVDLGVVQVDCVRLPEALAWLAAAVERHGGAFACFCEASLLSNVMREAAVARAVCAADAVFADGVALVLLARLQGHRLPERIPGPTFILAACEYGVARGWKHFFYGGAPGVADRLAHRLADRFPGLRVVGTFSPPFRDLTPREEAEVKARIEGSGADILWVCLGSPRQELWVAERVGRIRVPVMLPVGAAFDFHAGYRLWAPACVRRLGMEWAFRAVTGGPQTFRRNLRCVTRVGGLLVRTAVLRLVGQAGAR